MSIGEKSQFFPWVVDEEAARKLIRQALESGINFFDTANLYAFGTSEEFLGRALRDYADRDEVVIATKAFFGYRQGPNTNGLSRKHLMAECDASLKRLGTDFIDLYQIHRWDEDTPIEETMEALHDLIKMGKVRYIGASTMSAWQFAKAQQVAERNGWTKFTSMQNQVSLLYREEEREMLPLCADQGVGVIPRSPLARGRVTRGWDEQTERSGGDRFQKMYLEEMGSVAGGIVLEQDRKIVEAVGEIAQQRGVTRAQVGLAWVLQKPEVAAPIVGVGKDYHLTDAVAALDVDLTQDEIARLEADYIPHPVAPSGAAGRLRDGFTVTVN